MAVPAKAEMPFDDENLSRPSTSHTCAQGEAGRSEGRAADHLAGDSPVSSDRLMPPCGNFHDNLEVLFAVKIELRAGRSKCALKHLRHLESYIASSADPKNKSLLPHLPTLFEAARQMDRTEKRRCECLQGSKSSEGEQDGAHFLKARLVNATVLLTTVLFLMSFLVDDLIRAHPALASKPMTAHVIAGSALIVALLTMKKVRK
jgi:hypothetical protein